MTTNAQLTEYVDSRIKAAEVTDTIKNISDSLKKEFFVVRVKEESDEENTPHYNKILNITLILMKRYSNSYSKSVKGLELNEIEVIKNELAEYGSPSKKVEEFKNGVLEDLTNFQKRINTNHIQKIVDLTKQKQAYEKEVSTLNYEKQNLLKGNLFKFLGANSNQAKLYEAKIAATKLKVQQIVEKVATLEKTMPVANEKDILIYNMYIKEKYAQLNPQVLCGESV